MDEEIWKMIPGFEGRYMVSNLGRVRSLITGRVLRAYIETNRYAQVKLRKDQADHQFNVAILVCAAFLGKRPKGFDVCHNNGIGSDNRLENLRYDTRKGNHADKKLHGTYQIGDKSGHHKLTESDIPKIRADNRLRREVAADYGVTRGCITHILLGRTWSHIE